MTREEALKQIREWDFLNDEERAALETLIPELRESEDEWVRKEIIHYLFYTAGGLSTEEQNRWIAYMEKQKEQPTDAKSERVIKAARKVLENWLDGSNCPDVSGDFTELEHAIRGFDGEEKQKEQKPILEVFDFKVGDAVRLKDGDGRKHIIKSFEEVEGLHGPNFYHVEFEDNSARDGIYPGEEYPNGYYTQMEKIEEEQKPAWSEEDELIVTSIIDVLKRFEHLGATDMKIDWLENELKSLRPQPHWKPSKEQIGALNYAYCELFKRGDVEHNILGSLQKLIDQLREQM